MWKQPPIIQINTNHSLSSLPGSYVSVVFFWNFPAPSAGPLKLESALLKSDSLRLSSGFSKAWPKLHPTIQKTQKAQCQRYCSKVQNRRILKENLTPKSVNVHFKKAQCPRYLWVSQHNPHHSASIPLTWKKSNAVTEVDKSSQILGQ